jgi:hypothetical protein
MEHDALRQNSSTNAGRVGRRFHHRLGGLMRTRHRNPLFLQAHGHPNDRLDER